jgi:hypothetical protein
MVVVMCAVARLRRFETMSSFCLFGFGDEMDCADQT